MELRNIIFHELQTAQHQKEVLIFPRNSELELPDPNADKLVDEALNSLSGDSSIAYAQLDNHGWLPDRLREFIQGNIDFESFSIYALKALRERLQDEPLTTGGYLFLVHFHIESERYLMVLLLKDVEGLVINNILIEESHILNLDKLHFAALIEIEKWYEEELDNAYISFLKGIKRVDVTSYFKRFLCINEDTFNDPSKNTKQLVQAIKDYCQDNLVTDEQRFSVRARIDLEIRNRIENNEEITIEVIAALVNPDNMQSFINFLNKSDYTIQPKFLANKQSLRGLTRLSGRSDEISISFEQSAIEKGKISFSPSDNPDSPAKLIINEIPRALLSELEKLFD